LLIFFICDFDLEIFAVGVSYIVSAIFNVLMIWGFIYFFNTLDKKILKFRSKSIFSKGKIIDQLRVALVLSALAVLDAIDSETMSIQAAYLSSDKYTVYNLLYSVYQFTSCFSGTFYTATAIIIAYAVGSRNIDKVTSWFKYLLFTALFITVLATIVTLALSSPILNLIISDKSYYDTSMKIFPFMANTISKETFANVLRNTLKALGKFVLCLIITIIVVSFNALFIYLFAFTLNWDIYGIYTGYYLYLALSIITYAIVLTLIDWKDCINERSKTIMQAADLPILLTEESPVKIRKVKI